MTRPPSSTSSSAWSYSPHSVSSGSRLLRCLILLLSDDFVSDGRSLLEAIQQIHNTEGGDIVDTSSFSCMFQYLVEFVVGLKVPPLVKSNELYMLAHHQSGYSFNLTWIGNSEGEVELLYRVLSLGTFKRVAPEWMKETLISSSICNVFFQRISHLINS